MNNFDYLHPATADEAFDKSNTTDGAVYVAGGTNIIDLWKYDLLHPSVMIDLNGISGEKGIKENEDGSVLLSALMTNAETAYHPVIEGRYPLLSRGILAGASPQIRNMATNGGNLLQRTRCYYFYDSNSPCNKRLPGSGCPAREGYNRIHAILGASEQCIAVFPSDMCVALAALDATVHVSGLTGNRSIGFEDFHRLPGDTPEIDNNLKYGEVITGIELPAKGFAKNYAYLKLRDRHSYAFALVSVAIALELDENHITEARIALGGVAHKPWRIKEAEEMLKGKSADAASFADAADIILAGAQGFEHNHFKIELAKRAVIRCGLMALEPESQLPGAQPSL
ncbi:xanthine dehydrogenase family protein subunit M [Panacibacter sp. DH6]|uniref:Xanthine dehydrogenase family protein subunit M n=1 Tax=Panacibacter microcysteis TaxID=2793269 RepID=A0A931ME61_9BACT|nr:xanthine dehydrogenase family protein subunit M [Panacibacter microcysteis]MBG9378099.1 xanthine dehydrogenase family protein subunit M [Panacibacter microcysteis]